MFIPLNTDAPLYHFPFATIGLIVVNIFCFALTGFAFHAERLEPWLLEYGNGLNPVQWITAAFLHGGFMHLIGNMFFLWGFGLVVEGKLGWLRFVPLYFALAAAWGAGVDLLTIHRTDAYVVRHEFELESREALKQQLLAESADDAGRPTINQDEAEHLTGRIIQLARGRCLGASGVIFALMAISLVWAPKNEMHVMMFFGFRVFFFDITILVFSMCYLGLNLLGFLLSPGMGSSGLHLIGCAVGFPLGVLFLKRHWVDCEKWDLFSVLSGKYGRFAEKDWALGAHGNPNNYLKEIPVPDSSDEPEAIIGNKGARVRKQRQELAQVNQLIDSGDVLTAADELLTLRLQNSDVCPEPGRVRKLAIGLLQAQAFDEAEIWLQEFIDRFPEENAWARIRMAQLMLTQRQRPQAALTELKGLPLEGLSEQLQALAKKIAKSARDMVRDGVRDAEPEW